MNLKILICVPTDFIPNNEIAELLEVVLYVKVDFFIICSLRHMLVKDIFEHLFLYLVIRGNTIPKKKSTFYYILSRKGISKFSLIRFAVALENGFNGKL